MSSGTLDAFEREAERRILRATKDLHYGCTSPGAVRAEHDAWREALALYRRTRKEKR